MTVDDKGQPTIALGNATETQLYALADVTVEDIESGRRRGKQTRIKLPDRIAALKLLGQQHGMFKNDLQLSGGRPMPVVLSSAEAAL